MDWRDGVSEHEHVWIADTPVVLDGQPKDVPQTCVGCGATRTMHIRYALDAGPEDPRRRHTPGAEARRQHADDRRQQEPQ